MTKKDLMPFTAGETSMRTIKEPWSEGEYTYASNGHIMVRIPKIDEVPIDQNPVHPKDSDKMFPPDDDIVEWHNLNDIPMPKKGKCKICNAKKGPLTCDECDGSGEVEFVNGYHEYTCECKTCEGEGKVDICPECDGTGKDGGVTPTLIGHSWFGDHLLALARSLPNCKLGLQSKRLRTALLRFDGGDGLLMPMNIPND